MGRKHFKPEQVIHMLREAEITLAGGKTTGEVCRELGISEQSHYRWRKEYGGMQVSRARKLKELCAPNTTGAPCGAFLFTGVSHLDRALFDKPAKPVWTPERSEGEAPQAPANLARRAIPRVVITRLRGANRTRVAAGIGHQQARQSERFAAPRVVVQFRPGLAPQPGCWTRRVPMRRRSKSRNRASDDPANSPIPFALDYDATKVRAGTHYAVRGTTRHAERLLFTSDKHYPVLTRGAGNTAEMVLLWCKATGAEHDPPRTTCGRNASRRD